MKNIVIVVDDLPSSADQFKRTVERCGYDARVCYSVEDAYSSICELTLDPRMNILAVITDLKMPSPRVDSEHGGYDILNLCSSLQAPPPLMAVSARLDVLTNSLSENDYDLSNIKNCNACYRDKNGEIDQKIEEWLNCEPWRSVTAAVGLEENPNITLTSYLKHWYGSVSQSLIGILDENVDTIVLLEECMSALEKEGVKRVSTNQGQSDDFFKKITPLIEGNHVNMGLLLELSGYETCFEFDEDKGLSSAFESNNQTLKVDDDLGLSYGPTGNSEDAGVVILDLTNPNINLELSKSIISELAKEHCSYSFLDRLIPYNYKVILLTRDSQKHDLDKKYGSHLGKLNLDQIHVKSLTKFKNLNLDQFIELIEFELSTLEAVGGIPRVIIDYLVDIYYLRTDQTAKEFQEKDMTSFLLRGVLEDRTKQETSVDAADILADLRGRIEKEGGGAEFCPTLLVEYLLHVSLEKQNLKIIPFSLTNRIYLPELLLALNDKKETLRAVINTIVSLSSEKYGLSGSFTKIFCRALMRDAPRSWAKLFSQLATSGELTQMLQDLNKESEVFSNAVYEDILYVTNQLYMMEMQGGTEIE